LFIAFDVVLIHKPLEFRGRALKLLTKVYSHAFCLDISFVAWEEDEETLILSFATVRKGNEGTCIVNNEPEC
jgi:hypothetical protein